MMDAVYIPISGGLGDVLQVYLSSPSSPVDLSGYPSSDPTHALWFRRLESLKEAGVSAKIKLIMASHNPHSADLFTHHPCIDGAITRKWMADVDGKKPWELEEERQANIHAVFKYKDYEPREPVVYMSAAEEKLVSSIIKAGRYIVIHPFAGVPTRIAYPPYSYKHVCDYLVDNGFHVVVVGKSYRRSGAHESLSEFFRHDRRGVVSLVDVVSVRESVNLVLNADGFIGTHSAMILAAWYKRIKSVCLVPPKHDTGIPFEEFFALDVKENPTGWGANQDFNTTIVVSDWKSILVEDIVGGVLG